MNAGNATADLFNLTVTRLNKLSEILNLSGCRKSVCTSLLMMMPDVNNQSNSLTVDKLNKALSLSGCQTWACTSLLMMMPDVRSPNSSLVADKAVIKTATIKYVMFISGQKLNVLWNLLI